MTLNLTTGNVLARLVYGQDGEPMIVAAGAKRDRARDLADIKAWMRAFAKHIGAPDIEV